MKTITFYSYKGGTGRSLLLANYARYLSSCEKKVFIVDCDLEAPGLHHKFGQYGLYNKFSEWVQNQESSTKFGLCDYILIYLQDESVPVSLNNFCYELNFPETKNGSCLFIPAGNAPTESYAAKVLDIDWKKLFTSGESIGIPFFKKLQEKIYRQYQPDFLLIDSRTGISDIGGVVSNFLPDIFVGLFLNNDENIEGTKEILKSFRKAKNKDISAKPDKIICVLSRMPNDDFSIIDSIKERIGVTEETFLSVHNEPELQIFEELRFGSKKTLGESITLRDYLRIFHTIDSTTAEISPYFKLMQYLDPLSVPGKNEQSNRINYISSDKVSLGTEILKNIIERDSNENEFRYTDFKYVGGNSYEKLRKNIIDVILKKVNKKDIKLKKVIEKEINWDLLPLQMQAKKLDFCTEPYYLTGLRSITTGIIQFGWLRTYTCFIKSSDEIKEIILKNRNKEIDILVKDLLNEIDSNMQICYMGETAATSEATKRLSSLISGKNVHFRKDSKDLYSWYTSGNKSLKLIICDHSVAWQINELRVNKEHQYLFATNGAESDNHRKNLVFAFKYNKNIPVGFLYPQGDSEWRKIICDAFGEVIKNDKDLWGNMKNENSISYDLWQSGIFPLTFNELKRSIVLGKTPDDARTWINEIGG